MTLYWEVREDCKTPPPRRGYSEIAGWRGFQGQISSWHIPEQGVAILSNQEHLLVKGPKPQLGGMPLKRSCLATSDGPGYPFGECHWRKGWGEGGGGGGQEETTHYLPIYPAFQRTAPCRQSQK